MSGRELGSQEPRRGFRIVMGWGERRVLRWDCQGIAAPISMLPARKTEWGPIVGGEGGRQMEKLGCGVGRGLGRGGNREDWPVVVVSVEAMVCGTVVGSPESWRVTWRTRL